MRQETKSWNSGITIAGRKICNPWYANDTVLLAVNERQLTTLLK